MKENDRVASELSAADGSDLLLRPYWFVLALAAVFLAAVFMRVYRLDSVPLGVHYDEILNGEIAERALREGPQYFYDTAGGREGLYHLFLTASFALPLPVAWQLRLPSVLISLLGVLLSYLWVARAFGRWAALTTAGLMAVSFWTVWMGRAALRVNAVLPVAAGAALLMLNLLNLARGSAAWNRDRQEHSRRLPAVVALGVVIGLAFYTYRAGMMVFVLYAMFAAYLMMFHRDLAWKLVLPLVIAVIVSSPIIVLFLTQPEADPRFGVIAIPWQALMTGDPFPALQGVVDNFGMFIWQGDLEPHYNLPGRPIFEPLGALLFIAGLALALWRWRQPLYAFCLLWLLAGLLPGIFTLPAPSFVHTVTAQGVTYVFPAIAVAAVHRTLAKWTRHGARLPAPALVVALVAVNALWTYEDYFHHWPAEPEVRGFHQSDLAQIASDLDDLNTAQAVAICSSVLNEEDSFWRSGRQSFPYMLNREDLAVRWYDCAGAQVLPASNGEALLYFPNGATFGGWLDAPDAFVQDEIYLHEDVAKVTVDVSGWRQALLAELARPVAYQTPVQFAGEMAFLGYHMRATDVSAGGEMALLTFWEVTGALLPDTSVFVHLMQDENTLLAQGDSFSTLSDTLMPGDIIAQHHRIPVPTNTAPGSYPLSVGVYSRTGAHPPLTLVINGADHGTRLLLAEINVLPGS